MRAAIAFLLTFAVGCADGGAPDEELDLMGNCRTPFNRQVVRGWTESSAATAGGPLNSLTLPNESGEIQMVALGSSDTVGGVVVTPQIQDGSSGVLKYIVAAGAPLIGSFRGPLIVTPLFLPSSLTFASDQSNLDIVTFDVLPPFFPAKRAPLFYAEVWAAAATETMRVPVRGRSRILVTIAPGAGTTTDSFEIGAYVYGAVTGGGTSYSSLVQSGAYATVGAANVVHQFFPTTGAPAGAYPGADVLDTVVVSKTSAASDRNFTVIVQAWD